MRNEWGLWEIFFCKLGSDWDECHFTYLPHVYTPSPPSFTLTCVSSHLPEGFLGLLCLLLVPPLPTLSLLLTLTHKCWELRHWPLRYPLTNQIPESRLVFNSCTQHLKEHVFQNHQNMMKKTRTCATEGGWRESYNNRQIDDKFSELPDEEILHLVLDYYFPDTCTRPQVFNSWQFLVCKTSQHYA